MQNSDETKKNADAPASAPDASSHLQDYLAQLARQGRKVVAVTFMGKRITVEEFKKRMSGR